MNPNLLKSEDFLNWAVEKVRLHQIALRPTFGRRVSRGGIYMCDLGIGVGSEENKKRPCLVISSKSINENSRNVVVVPISNQGTPDAFHIPVNCGSAVTGNYLPANVVTVSKSRLDNFLKHAPASDVKAVEESVIRHFGMGRVISDLAAKDARIIRLLQDIDTLKTQVNELETKLTDAEDDAGEVIS